MNINAITSANSNLSSSSTSGAGQTSERDLFMSLLVAQLKNQDPLQPQDGTEFVAQLAQFNSLDQLVGIRESIEQLTIQMQQLQNQNPQNSDTTSKN
jgi:flagellar basal-body rod modification protein FlgD